jgi:hypothetical protein
MLYSVIVIACFGFTLQSPPALARAQRQEAFL